MIVVKNTLELERNYNINALDDNEQITILGGLNKTKYMGVPKYQIRSTYNAGEIKQILERIHHIESKVDPTWSPKKKALFLYYVMETGMSYDKDKTEYVSNSLRVFLTGKAICAGFSLAYKELIDRQQFDPREVYCDYVRGVSNNASRIKHAWNALQFGNECFLVDLTKGSDNYHTNGELYTAFGCSPASHFYTADPDEKPYNFLPLTKRQIEEIFVGNSINTPGYDLDATIRLNRVESNQATSVDRKQIIDYAIHRTFLKFKRDPQVANATNSVAANISRYVEERLFNRFTNEGNARTLLMQNDISQVEMLNSVIETYVDDVLSGNVHIPNITDENICSYEINYRTHFLASQQGRDVAVQELSKYILSNGKENSMNLMTPRGNVLFLMAMEKVLSLEEKQKNKNISVGR